MEVAPCVGRLMTLPEDAVTRRLQRERPARKADILIGIVRKVGRYKNGVVLFVWFVGAAKLLLSGDGGERGERELRMEEKLNLETVEGVPMIVIVRSCLNCRSLLQS